METIITVTDGDGDAYIIAKLPPPLDGGAKEFIDNARLCAAAPELYEATRIALDLVTSVIYEHPYDDISKAQLEVVNKALHKAEGYTI